MRVTDLSPEWIIYRTGIADKYLGRDLPDGTIQWGGFECEYIPRVDDPRIAQGIEIYCPKCWLPGKGEQDGVGVHRLQVTFVDAGVLPHQGCHNGETPTRWSVKGSSFEDIQISPSIQIIGGCAWHGHIGLNVPGEVTTC
jgi:hypothetical protein